MSVARWTAENSDLIGWSTLITGALVADTAHMLGGRFARYPHSRRGTQVSAAAGLLLVASAAILAALGGGRGLWLTALSGFLCLVVALVLEFRALSGSLDNNALGLQWLTSRVTRVLEGTEHTASELMRLREAVEGDTARKPDVASRVASPVEFAEMAHGLAARGMWAPIALYTTASDGAGLKNATLDALAAFDLTVAAEEPVERASWFQRIWVRASNSDTLKERLRKLEHAVELQYVGKVRAEIDQVKAQAAAALLQAISTQDNAVIRIGSLIAIKAQGDLAVWTVSELEAADMERHGALLRDPVSALEYLRTLKHTTLTPGQQPREDRSTESHGNHSDR